MKLVLFALKNLKISKMLKKSLNFPKNPKKNPKRPNFSKKSKKNPKKSKIHGLRSLDGL
jgi:hypothetical protein